MFRPVTNSNFVPNQHPRAMKWDAQTPTPKLLVTLQGHRWRLDNMEATEVHSPFFVRKLIVKYIFFNIEINKIKQNGCIGYMDAIWYGCS